jgi:hypothetical protein
MLLKIVEAFLMKQLCDYRDTYKFGHVFHREKGKRIGHYAG